MPIRKTPIVTDEFYHIYNRGINKQNIFTTYKEYKRAVNLLNFYTCQTPIKFSRYNQLNIEDKVILTQKIKSLPHIVEVVAYCLMPNHYHLLLKGLTENGVVKYIKNVQSGFSHYFNLRHDRVGSLFQGNFKNVLIVDDEQLLHISRYIHLNPYSAGLVPTYEKLEQYQWSSFSHFLGREHGFCNPSIVLDILDKDPGVAQLKYGQFVSSQADYQRQLEKIKHLKID